jgi:energy-coupling factor transporter transmembrane protein EcfT
MSAIQFPLLDLFLTLGWFALLVIWVGTLIAVFTDLFRSHDLGGGAKALWFIFVLVLPFVGACTYLAVRGASMRTRAGQTVLDHEEAFNQYVSKAVGGPTVADELHVLHELRAKGALTDDEFESEKSRLLA